MELWAQSLDVGSAGKHWRVQLWRQCFVTGGSDPGSSPLYTPEPGQTGRAVPSVQTGGTAAALCHFSLTEKAVPLNCSLVLLNLKRAEHQFPAGKK